MKHHQKAKENVQTYKDGYELSIAAFDDSNKGPEYGKIGMVIGIFIVNFEADSIFQNIFMDLSPVWEISASHAIIGTFCDIWEDPWSKNKF